MCAVFQLATVDSSSTPTTAHLDAAIRHLEAAVDAASNEYSARVKDRTTKLIDEVNRLRRKLSI